MAAGARFGVPTLDHEDVDDLVMLPGASYSAPEYSWLNPIAVTSIEFLTESILGPGYHNAVMIGDNKNHQLYLFRLNGERDRFVFDDPRLSYLIADNSIERDLLAIGADFGTVTGIEVGPDRAVYVTSLRRGAIYGIIPEPTTIVLWFMAIVLMASRSLQRARMSGPVDE